MHGSMAEIQDDTDRPKTTFNSRSHAMIAQKVPEVGFLHNPSETSVSALFQAQQPEFFMPSEKNQLAKDDETTVVSYW